MSIKCQLKQKNMGPLVLPLIAAGASLASSAINAGSQSSNNQSQLSYAREMYDKQRADALADWNMQNEYNSPKAQMARFQEAGLNPNLIYGQMSNSPVVRTSSPQSYNPTAPQVDLGNAVSQGLFSLSQYQDTQFKQVQTDLVKQQIQNSITENSLKQLEWAERNIKLPFAQEIAKQSADALRLSNDKAVQEIAYKSEANPLAIKQTTGQVDLLQKQIDQVVANTKLTTAQKLNTIKDGILKNYEIKIRSMGGNPNDPGYIKAIQPIINEGAKKIQTLINNQDNKKFKIDGYTVDELLYQPTKFLKWMFGK